MTLEKAVHHGAHGDHGESTAPCMYRANPLSVEASAKVWLLFFRSVAVFAVVQRFVG